MIIISDIHVPFQNKAAVKLTFDFIKEVKPKYVAINGDAIDFYAISRYSRNPHRRLQLQDEINEFHHFLDELEDASPNSEKIFVEGNHEQRWHKYLRDHAMEYEGLKCMDLQQILSLSKRKVLWAPSGFTFGSAYIVHGDGLFGGKAGMTATKWMDRYMASCVVGHVHRLAIVHRRTASGRIFGMEAGTLGSLDPSYEMTGFADWQTGFCAITRYKSGLLVPSIHEIEAGAIYGELP